jgi:NADPH:quinone reductase
MRAAFYNEFGDPDRVQVGEMPDPEPGDGEVLIRNRAAAVGIWDVKMLRGMFGRQRAFPVVPGFEVAGTVERAAGDLSEGERVYGSLQSKGSGAYAELVVVPPDHLVSIPEGHDFSEASALVISAGTAYEGLVDRARLRAGESVLVTAASGGVGTAAVQIAAAIGAHVVAVASAGNHEYLRGLGVETTVDYHDDSFVQRLRDAAPGGYDVLFDGTGTEVRERATALLRGGGRGVYIVGPPKEPRADIDTIAFSATVGRERLTAINRYVSEGKLTMPIEAEYPLEQAAQAVAQVARGHTRGRVVLRIG